MDKPIVLEAHDLRFRYPTGGGCDAVFLELFTGHFCGLTGDNGAGKSTIFKLLTGQLTPQYGQIFLQGTPVTHLPQWRRVRLGIGYIAQECALFDALSAEDNILSGAWQLKRHEQKSRLKRLAGNLELTTLMNKKASTLSGGERRRIELARLLISSPTLLLLDEPFASLDHRSVELIIKQLKVEVSRGASILITEHNTGLINTLCDRIYLMHEHRLNLIK